MISKEGIKKSINHRTEHTYPGIKDYYSRYVADELIDYAMKESLDGIFMFRNSEIASKYNLNYNELMNVLFKMKVDGQNITYLRFHGYTEIHLKKNKCEHLLSDDDPIVECQKMLNGSYDENECGIKLFNKTYMKDLIYSTSQASKVFRDIIWKLQEKLFTPDHELICKEYVEEYIKDISGAKIYEEETDSGTKKITLQINNKSYLDTSYVELCRTLGIPLNTLEYEPVTETMLQDVMIQYNNAIKFSQIKGKIDDYLDYFVDQHDDMVDEFTEEFIDETAHDIEVDLRSFDLNYDLHEKLASCHLEFVQLETIDAVKKQYEMNKEKELLL